ncbi:MAG: helix-turn-helix domain-containing protein [Anaerolineae bacterium]
MTIVHEERPSDSPYIESVTRGRTLSSGSTIRPAECHWHMVFSTYQGVAHPLVVGPLSSAGEVSWGGDAEILWVKFKLGTYMPHLPVKDFRDTEHLLPDASSRRFWLHGTAWQLPDFDNVETFVDRLVKDDALALDILVNEALQDQLLDVPPRTLRHRFLHTTGLPQNHIRQFERAKQAAALLREGIPILDAVYELGYFDQPHLTRSLKRFVGLTPAQLLPNAQSTA